MQLPAARVENTKNRVLTGDAVDAALRPGSAKESYALTLLENGLDSLDEGLSQYRRVQDGRLKSAKFAVLAISHYLELLLKHCVHQLDEEAIWESAGKTIGIHRALSLLVNEGGVELPASFQADLKWFKELRNDVEHYQFELDAQQVRDVIARLLYDVDLVLQACHVQIDFVTMLDKENIVLFAELSKEYEARLAVAHQRVEDASKEAYYGVRPKFQDQVQFYVVNCDACGHETFRTNHDSPTGFQCEFCGEQRTDEMPANCTMCDQPWTLGELKYVEDWDGNGHSESICPRCLHHPDYVKDD